MWLYPRLRSHLGKPLIEQLTGASFEELERPRELGVRGLVWPPTGGRRVTEERLLALRAALRDTAMAHGFVYGVTEKLSLTRDQGLAVDQALAVTLHTQMELSAHEASEPDVWRYITCV
ncbi:MAG TPA: hypothetical protein PLA94_25240, partial [Myxococcota bacterium]|nr:hypothetical protein [Myxococcota bacterium]